MSRLFFFILTAISGSAFGQCIDSVTDMKWSEWRNEESKPKEWMMKRQSLNITRITVHYTAAKKNPKYDLKHKLRAVVNFSQHDTTPFKHDLWGDMPYHYYIDMTGKLGQGRDPKFRANTNTKYDPNGHITVVVEGDKTDVVSPAQKQKLFATIKALQNKYGIKTGGVGVHKHYSNDTDCPGPAVEAAVSEYKRLEANYIPDKTLCEEAPAQQAPQVKPARTPGPAQAPVKTKPNPRKSLPEENSQSGTSGSF